jgi:hypothetical protein
MEDALSFVFLLDRNPAFVSRLAARSVSSEAVLAELDRRMGTFDVVLLSERRSNRRIPRGSTVRFSPRHLVQFRDHRRFVRALKTQYD